jgi:hypothetical protein
MGDAVYSLAGERGQRPLSPLDKPKRPPKAGTIPVPYRRPTASMMMLMFHADGHGRCRPWRNQSSPRIFATFLHPDRANRHKGLIACFKKTLAVRPRHLPEP